MKVTGYSDGVPCQIEIELVDEAGHFLAKEPASAWLIMVAAARNDGIILRCNSGYRTMAHQQSLWRQHQEGTLKSTPARPGYSRHQMGTASDINRSHDDPDGCGPLIGPTDQWLEHHAAQYGWRRTVPSEPWHYEFSAEWIGVE